MARQTIPTSGLWSAISSLLNANFINAEDDTGWGQYSDSQYTSGSPFAIAGNTDTVLPNNSAGVIDSQKPSDIVNFYDGTVITGRDGDGLAITIDFNAVPTSGATTYIEVWLNIGGGLPDLYKRIISFPKGSGVVRPINFTVSAYTLNTWEANGATVYVRANGTADLYDIRYVLTRLHKAK